MSYQEINLPSRGKQISHEKMSDQETSASAQNTDWRITIDMNLEKARNAETPGAWHDVCIPRVPRKLRDVNPTAFDPQFVSIGPYHRGKDVLRDMDIHKWRCFRRILIRNNHDRMLYFDSIREVVEDAKRCYEGNINLSTYEWVETMVVDGCFLLDILFGFFGDVVYFEEMGYSRNDPVYSKRGPIEVTKEDMLKLENQLPLFILVRLLGLISNEMQDETGLTDLIVVKVLELFGLQEKIQKEAIKAFRYCAHCLVIYRCGLLSQFRPYFLKDETPPPPPRCGLFSQFRSYFLKDETKISLLLARFDRPCPPPPNPASAPSAPSPRRPLPLRPHGPITIEDLQIGTAHQHETIHTATMLREAGVKFKKRDTDCFLDVNYEAGVLYIPYLLLNGTRKSLIHNLIAFEQIYHGWDNHHEITRYAAFMDGLIDTSADVAYLHDCGIIDPSAGGSYDDAAAFFNQITNGVIFVKRDMYLREATEGLLKKINDYNNSRIRNWMVGTKSKYFSKPWSIISLIAATALLVLTFLQAFYGMYGYYRPRN